MVHGVSAPGLSTRPYFHRYTEDAVDLCDALSSFSPGGKATLHEISRVMGLGAERGGAEAVADAGGGGEGRLRRLLINVGIGRMSALRANRTSRDGGNDVNDPDPSCRRRLLNHIVGELERERKGDAAHRLRSCGAVPK